jgi:hypothetical protein
MKKPHLHIRFLFVTLLALLPITAFSQGFYTNFGQNRVQYDNFIWSYYESENFVTYFYQGGYDIAKFAATTAENSLADIETKLEFKNSSKVEIMVYHTLSDLKQTNIGIGIEANNTGGITKIIGNKIFVYFDGDYHHLEEQVREGISRVSMERMVFGTNIQEILQNAVLLNLPDWYTNGLVSYMGTSWSTELDNRLRQEMLSNNFDNFNKLSGERATLAGHALWHYIELMHGQVAIPNLLYLTRVNRSVESAFVFVLGNTINGTIEDFNEYYKNLYKSEATNRQTIAPDSSLLHVKHKNTTNHPQVVGQVRISPNGKYIAYTTNEIGRQLTWLYNTETQTRKRLVANGFKSYKQPWEENYPLLAWDADSRQLAIVYERRDQTVFTIYRPESGEKVRNPEITKFQQVTSMDFVNPRQLVFSAVQAGQIDLFLYDIPNTKTTRLTNDYYPEMQARFAHFANGKKGIVFASNRPNDTLKVEKLGATMPTDTYDLFFYDLNRITPPTEEGQTALLVRLTNTPLANESYPSPYDSLHVAYISDENGINNQYVTYLDSSLLRIDQRYIFKDSLIVNPNYPAAKVTEWRTKGLLERIDQDSIYKVFGKSVAISNYNKGIIQADVATLANSLVTLHFEDARYKLALQPIAQTPQALPVLDNTSYRNQMDNQARLKAAKAKAASIPKPIKNDIVIDFDNPLPISPNPINETPKIDTLKSDKNETIDIDNYSFQTEFDVFKTPKQPTPQNTETPNQAVGSPIATTIIRNANNSANKPADGPREFFKRTDIRSYLLQFGIDNVATQVDNTILFTPYQPFNGTGSFANPDLSGAFKVGCTDLFENYRIMGGFRIPLGLNGMEYFLQYDNVKKRLDKRLLFYRGGNVNSVTADDGTPQGIVVPLKQLTHLAEFTLSYPFDTYRSLRGTIGYRNDKAIFKSIDIPTLLAPSYVDNWANIKLEYVFDNTINTGLNLLNGTRAKTYFDVRKQFNGIVNTNQFEVGFKDTKFVGIVGVDARHYQKVHRQMIWATRFAAAHSFGNAKILYYLGGPENWLTIDPNKKFDQTNPIDQSEEYGFQALATNMRGFSQNVRNGTSYFVLNTELRVPVFTYLLNTQISSEMLKNFQLIAFADLGSAWMGVSPFDERSQYTIITNDSNPAISTTTKYFRNPIVGSYGWGARTKLLGYFVRMDVGWGIDTGVRNKARWQFSLGMDF